MEKKKLALILLIVACSAGLISLNIMNKSHKETNNDLKQTETPSVKEEIVKENIEQEEINNTTKENTEKTLTTSVEKVSVIKKDDFVKKSNLLKDLSNNSIPISAISEISDLPQNIQEAVLKVAETNNGIYMVKRNADKLLLVVDNPNNMRHGVDFVEISLKTGHQVNTTLGYSDKMKDSNNDYWEYDKTTKLPVKHIKYNAEGDTEFTEVWNYDSNNPVKYEMKDGEGKVISIKKETIDNQSNMRVENLIYDKEGKTKVNVSATYEGSDLKRFTYYNADKPSDSETVYGEYSENGVKTRETVYTSDLKVKNSYLTDYSEDKLKEIKVLNNENKEIEKIISE